MSYFADIVVALRNEIMNVITDDNAVIVTARRELPVIVGDKDVLIRIRSLKDMDGETAAGGRYTKWIRRPVDIIMRARQQADYNQQDLRWLIDETNGILDIEAKLLDQLEMWHPVVGSGGDNPQHLLIEPARIVSGQDPLRDIVNPRGSSDPTCGMLAFTLDLFYEQSLRQDVQ